jgi:uncharacterized protein (TIGR04255 family)
VANPLAPEKKPWLHSAGNVVLWTRRRPMVFGRLSVGFKKPPVVEAWIEFRFALTQEDSQWDEDAARSLMKTCFEEFAADRFLKSMSIDVNMRPGQPGPTATPEFSFERVRAFSQSGEHCIQAGRNVFVFNQLKRTTWLKFDCMRDAALSAVQKYMSFRNLDELTGVSLHYRDVVTIPTGDSSGIEFRDWFHVYPEVPTSSFGSVSAFTFAVQLPSMCERAVAVISIQSLPSMSEEDRELRFSIDWDVSSVDKVEGLESARQWLDSAHEGLHNSFQKAFTAQCLALFEPSEGE